MPSPFPGMDPFLESQTWRDFHTEFITAIRAVLMNDADRAWVREILPND